MSRPEITPEEKAVVKIVEAIKPKEALPEIVYGVPQLPPRSNSNQTRQCYEVKVMLKMLERGEPGMTMTYSEHKDAERAASRLRSYIDKVKKRQPVKKLPVLIEQSGCKVGVTVLGRVTR